MGSKTSPDIGEIYTYTNYDVSGIQVDISHISEIEVNYCDGAGGESYDYSGGSGGRAENVIIDVSNENNLYIWVAEDEYGRYNGERLSLRGDGAGSTEISFSDQREGDTSDAPVLVGAGGGAGGAGDPYDGCDGARGGGAGGTNDPQGGSGTSTEGEDGHGYIDSRSIISGGSTTTGGGSSSDTNGEVKITYGVNWDKIATYGSAWSDTLDDGDAPEGNAGNAVRSDFTVTEDPPTGEIIENNTDHDQFISTDIICKVEGGDSGDAFCKVQLYDKSDNFIENIAIAQLNTILSGVIDDSDEQIMIRQQLGFIIPSGYGYEYGVTELNNGVVDITREYKYDLYSKKA